MVVAVLRVKVTHCWAQQHSSPDGIVEHSDNISVPKGTMLEIIHVYA